MTKTECIVMDCLARMNKAVNLQNQIADELDKIIGSDIKLWDLIVQYKESSLNYHQAINSIYAQGLTMDKAFRIEDRINAQKCTEIGSVAI